MTVRRMLEPGSAVSPSPPRWVLLALILAVALGAFGLVRHEMWRDELQAWQIARDSTSLVDVLRNCRYEGHPPLWHYLLYGLSRFSDDPRCMQILHFFVAATVLVLLALVSPFTPTEKVMLMFTYFLTYEYFVISRAYSIGVLALFAGCALFVRQSPAHLPALAVATVLCASTSAYGFILGAALAVTTLVRFFAVSPGSKRPGPTTGHAWIFVIVVATGLCSVAILSLPPSDGAVIASAGPRVSAVALVRVLATLVDALVPLPIPGPHSWNSLLVQSTALKAPVAVALLAIVAAALHRSRDALVFFAVAVAGQFIFANVVFMGQVRHHGHLFLALVAALWLAGGSALAASAADLPDGPGFRLARRSLGPLFRALLLVQAVLCMFAHFQDGTRPFSCAEAAASAVTRLGWDPRQVAGHPDFAASAVAGYLGVPIFYPMTGRTGSFVVWNGTRRSLDAGEALAAVSREATRRNHALLYVSNEPCRDLTPVASLQGSILVCEQYWLYIVAPET